MDGYAGTPLFDLKGNTVSLDPRSKIITTLIFVFGVAISIDYFQVFVYLLLFIPISFVFKPRIVFIRRILVSIPFILFFCIIVYMGIQTNEVTINILGYSRTYSKLYFTGFIAYRYFVIVLFNYMLIHSEDSYSDIIEAFASFRLSQGLITILLLIRRLSIRIRDDYNKMIEAARIKGAFQSGRFRSNFLKLTILGQLLARSNYYSKIVAQALTARGFHDHFSPTTRSWTTEGLTVVMFSILMFVEITLIPWMR